MALMEISIVPIGTTKTGLSLYVAGVIKVVQESGLDFELSDMGTIVEGEADELLKLAACMHDSVFQHDVKRVYTVIKLDDRRDKETSLGEKSASVWKKLKP